MAERSPRVSLPAADSIPRAMLAFSSREISTRCVYERAVLLFAMIAGFRNADTEKLWTTGRCKRLPAQLNRQALKKLYILNAALALENLGVPPGNRLEKLHRDQEGQHSIRINDQYRICFVWRDGNAHAVEITDYH